MVLSKVSADEHGIILGKLCNALEPRLAVYFSSTSVRLRLLLTPALLQQLRADHEAAAALCRKMGTSCKELREEKDVYWANKRPSAADLATLGKLSSVLPTLKWLTIFDFSRTVGPDGVQRLAEGLGAGALPAVELFSLGGMHVGNTRASALAAALGRGALPRLDSLFLCNAAIGDVGLVALAPALRQRPALEKLSLMYNPLGSEGLAAFLALPPPAGALLLPTGGLKKVKMLDLSFTQVSDAGCATLVSALDSGALPALQVLSLNGILASAAAKEAVHAALARSRAALPS